MEVLFSNHACLFDLPSAVPYFRPFDLCAGYHLLLLLSCLRMRFFFFFLWREMAFFFSVGLSA
jgi:hypothetical protein